MSQRAMRLSMLSGLILIGHLGGTGREASAANLAAGKINIAGGIVLNDPPEIYSYTYQLDVYVTGGTASIATNSTFELKGLTAVDAGSVVTPSNGATWMVTITPDGSVMGDGNTYGVSDVTWTLLSGPISVTNGTLVFFSATTDPVLYTTLPPTYPDYVTTGVSYEQTVYTPGNPNPSTIGSDLHLIIGGVPEPATLTQALGALASVPVICFFRWRRSRNRTARTA